MNEKAQHPTRSPNREANERFVHIKLAVPVEYENGRRVKALTAFIRNIDGVDYASFAEVDERDQFCRRRGRVVARRKFFNGKRVPLALIDESLYDAALQTWMDS